ncbi:CBS domain-containing protein [Oribacterium sp. KHPX15]|uniref:CBS domain-containing protein n=1 Tax=unclassified Oribacterium TaxID=2629782 RepID=UPI0004E16982|nr:MULTISPECIES: CBS domain-containing protein [unclassified Oribacterium]SEA54025.1 CBS domain-containing protein [Oribacterium sp. KHPX15]
MNILFFLTPKCDVAFLEEDYTLRQALEKMEFHRYSTIPVLAKDGSYIGTMTEGDLLWEIKNNLEMNLDSIEKIQVSDIPMKTHYAPVDVNASMEDLMERVSNQNFVPVVDDMKHFIGIIRRKEIINYLYANSNLSHSDLRVLA